MPTKADLEATIAERDQRIADLEQALEKLGRDELVRVILPWAPHGLLRSQAPYLSGAQFKDPNRFQALVMEPLVEALKRRGFIDGYRTPVAGEIELAEGTDRGKESILIDRATGEILAELLDGIIQFSREAFTAGQLDGSNLLGKLVEGEITPDQFENSRQRAIARTKQNERTTISAKLEASQERIRKGRER